MQKKSIILTFAALMIALTAMLLSGCSSPAGSSKLLEDLYAYSGYTRVISEEEFDFYKYFVERDLPSDTSAEEIEQKTKAYAERVNAKFFLGNKLNLCEAYSFELLKLRMEQENEARRIKLEQGEIIYGLEQFTLENYFLYTLDNLEVELHKYLEMNADEGIMKLAKDYYEENRQLFRYREEISYEVTYDGRTEILTADGDQLNALGKADMGLADFLNAAEIGDTYEDMQGDQKRTVVVKEITYNEEGFEKNKSIILYQFVRGELYEDVIAQIAINNPVEF